MKFMRPTNALGAVLAGTGVLVAGLSFGYHQVIQLPTEGRVRHARYETCLQQARDASQRRWAKQCIANAKERPAHLANCLKSAGFETRPYVREGQIVACRQNFEAPTDADCKLPQEEAQRFDGMHQAARERCLAEAEARV